MSRFESGILEVVVVAFQQIVDRLLVGFIGNHCPEPQIDHIRTRLGGGADIRIQHPAKLVKVL
jgi:hypothetical protein